MNRSCRFQIVDDNQEDVISPDHDSCKFLATILHPCRLIVTEITGLYSSFDYTHLENPISERKMIKRYSRVEATILQIVCFESGGNRIVRPRSRSLPLLKVDKQRGSFEGVDILCLPVILIILGLRHSEYS